jgi:hypothetical protein
VLSGGQKSTLLTVRLATSAAFELAAFNVAKQVIVQLESMLETTRTKGACVRLIVLMELNDMLQVPLLSLLMAYVAHSIVHALVMLRVSVVLQKSVGFNDFIANWTNVDGLYVHGVFVQATLKFLASSVKVFSPLFPRVLAPRTSALRTGKPPRTERRSECRDRL